MFASIAGSLYGINDHFGGYVVGSRRRTPRHAIFGPWKRSPDLIGEVFRELTEKRESPPTLALYYVSHGASL
jgi:hypothetical protein